jgi:hypothetical protein
MTTEITIAHRGIEILLELEVSPEEPMTRHYPGAPAEFEIISAHDRDGEVLDDDKIEIIARDCVQEVWDALEQKAEYTRDDYLLEKHEDDARESRYMRARYKI